MGDNPPPSRARCPASGNLMPCQWQRALPVAACATPGALPVAACAVTAVTCRGSLGDTSAGGGLGPGD